MRTFVAVFFPGEINTELSRLIHDLSREAIGVKWVEGENLHMTLRFLGEMNESDLGKLSELASAASREVRSCTGRLSGLGAFPSLERPRVFWVAMKEGGTELVDLSQKLERGLVEGGFGKADKPFRPHLTIGRVRVPKGIDALTQKIKRTEFETESFPIDSFSIVKSTLTGKGPIYTKLSTFKLLS